MMPSGHHQRSDAPASKRSRAKHAAVLLDLWSSSDEEKDETPVNIPSYHSVLASDSSSPERSPIVTFSRLPTLAPSREETTFDIGESIFHQLKRERKRFGKDTNKCSAEELTMPPSNQVDKSLPKRPTGSIQTSIKSFVTETREPTTNLRADCSKTSQRESHTLLATSRGKSGIAVEQIENIEMTGLNNWSLQKNNGRICSGNVKDNKVAPSDFLKRQQEIGSALFQNSNGLVRAHTFAPVISNGNKFHSQVDKDHPFRVRSGMYNSSLSRANIGWPPTNNPNSDVAIGSSKYRGLKGPCHEEQQSDESTCSSDSESILSPSKSKVSSPGEVLPLAQRIILRKKSGSGLLGQRTLQKPVLRIKDTVRDSEEMSFQKTKSQERWESNVASQRQTTAHEGIKGLRQLGKSKRSMKVVDHRRNKKARVLSTFLTKSKSLDSSSGTSEIARTEFELRSAESSNRLRDAPVQAQATSWTAQKGHQKIIELFGRTTSDDEGDETEEDEERVQDRQEGKVIPMDTAQDVDRDARPQKQQTESIQNIPVDLDSTWISSKDYQSASRNALPSEGPSAGSQQKVSSSFGRDEGVILIDITQSAERGAMSGQVSPRFRPSSCLGNCNSSPSQTKKELTPVKIKPVPPIKIRSNVAWDDDVIHIDTTRLADTGTSSECSIPTIHVPTKFPSFSSPGSSLIFPQHTSGNNPPSEYVSYQEKTLKHAHRKSSKPPEKFKVSNQIDSNTFSLVSGQTVRTHSKRHRRGNDIQSSLVLAGQVHSHQAESQDVLSHTLANASFSSMVVGKSSGNYKTGAEKVQNWPSTNTTYPHANRFTCRLGQVAADSQSQPDIQVVGNLHTSGLEQYDEDTVRPSRSPVFSSISRLQSSVTSSTQDIQGVRHRTTQNRDSVSCSNNASGSSTYCQPMVEEVSNPQTDSMFISPVAGVNYVDGGEIGVSRHGRVYKSSKRSRHGEKQNRKHRGRPTSPDVMEVDQFGNERRESRHRKEHKSSKESRRMRREKRLSGRSASPDVIELVRQVENDEAMAKQLQEEFDAEVVRMTEVASNNQPIIIPDVNDPGFIPMLPELPSLFPNAHHPAFPNHHHQGSMRDMRWRDDLVDINPVNAAMMMEMDRFLVDNMEGHIGQHIHLPPPRQRSRGQRRGRGRGRRNPHHMQSPMGNGADYETLWSLTESVGPAVSKGLPESSINYLPTFLYTPGQASEEKECSICMGDYETGENMRRLPCFHFYHAACIDKWLKENRICPVCREEVNFDPVNFN